MEGVPVYAPRVMRSMFSARGYRDISSPAEVKVGKMRLLKVTAVYDNPRGGSFTENIAAYMMPFNHEHESKISSKEIKRFDDGKRHVILVLGSCTSAVVAAVESIGTHSEVLSYEDIAFEKHKHRFVPKYKMYTESEVRAIEKRMKCSRKNFEKMIAKQDAMARYLDFRPGDVVGEPPNFRLVVTKESIV